MGERLGRSTVSVLAPVWADGRFEDEEAQRFWSMLPPELQAIALAELLRGNLPGEILHNEERGIALLAFRSGPRTVPPQSEQIRIHRRHKYGNYCDDGTLCTYEHLGSGCFLAFDDPTFRENAGAGQIG
jgi:hypothetical protein